MLDNPQQAEIDKMDKVELANRLALIGLRGEARELSQAFTHVVVAVGLLNGQRVGQNAYTSFWLHLLRMVTKWDMFAIAYNGVILAWRE